VFEMRVDMPRQGDLTSEPLPASIPYALEGLAAHVAGDVLAEPGAGC